MYGMSRLRSTGVSLFNCLGYNWMQLLSEEVHLSTADTERASIPEILGPFGAEASYDRRQQQQRKRPGDVR